MASSEIECECDCGCPDEICECDDCECEHADECGAVLPPRYKGRQRIYCGNTCRKNYTSKRP